MSVLTLASDTDAAAEVWPRDDHLTRTPSAHARLHRPRPRPRPRPRTHPPPPPPPVPSSPPRAHASPSGHSRAGGRRRAHARPRPQDAPCPAEPGSPGGAQQQQQQEQQQQQKKKKKKGRFPRISSRHSLNSAPLLPVPVARARVSASSNESSAPTDADSEPPPLYQPPGTQRHSHPHHAAFPTAAASPPASPRPHHSPLPHSYALQHGLPAPIPQHPATARSASYHAPSRADRPLADRPHATLPDEALVSPPGSPGRRGACAKSPRGRRNGTKDYDTAEAHQLVPLGTSSSSSGIALPMLAKAGTKTTNTTTTTTTGMSGGSQGQAGGEADGLAPPRLSTLFVSRGRARRSRAQPVHPSLSTDDARLIMQGYVRMAWFARLRCTRFLRLVAGSLQCFDAALRHRLWDVVVEGARVRIHMQANKIVLSKLPCGSVVEFFVLDQGACKQWASELLRASSRQPLQRFDGL